MVVFTENKILTYRGSLDWTDFSNPNEKKKEGMADEGKIRMATGKLMVAFLTLLGGCL